MRKKLLPLAGIAALCYASMASGAAFVNVGLARGELYLIVGPVGAARTAPANVTMTVLAAQMGDPLIPIVGTPNVQVQMGIRTGLFGPQITATLTATAPAGLASGANQIPIDQISWTSVGLTPAWRCEQTISGGAFVAGGGPQVLDTLINTSRTVWSCGELTFSFANAQAYPAGTYTGTVTLTASRT
jgi:hypothetical protein